MLTESIASLRDRAARPDLLDILVACDPDDPETARAAAAASADAIWQAPYRFGYAESARYHAALLGLADGEWTMTPWNDDAIMQTEGWDDIVRAQTAGSIIWTDGNIPGLTCFPVVHADVLAALGRLCPLPAVDTWFQDIGLAAGVITRPGIYVHQDRFDLTGRNGDDTYREGRGGIRCAEFYSEPYTTWRAEDAARLAALR
jgi:hypothetical protein